MNHAVVTTFLGVCRFACAFVFLVTTLPLAGGDEPADHAAAKVAAILLDDSQSDEARQRLIDANPKAAAELIARMAQMPAGSDEDEEYRRIPWIWRVAIAAGKRNDDSQIRDALAASLPQPGEPLRDWQAVVIGGGLINGVSQAGAWPKQRFDALLDGDEDLTRRWRRGLEEAARMADDAKVRTGTRYDALRMIALDGWPARGEQLVKYLAKEVDGELQMGAVSALADIDEPAAAKALVSHLKQLNETNAQLALDGLLRSAGRAKLLLDAVEAGQVAPAEIGAARIERLREHPDAAIARRARDLLPAP
jgi:hypothetical protein